MANIPTFRPNRFVTFVIGIVVLAAIVSACVEAVDTGHEAVGTLFGRVTGDVLPAGIHLVSPLKRWTHYSTLTQTTLFEEVQVPAQDQQKASMDISVQWRLSAGQTELMRSETGDQAAVFRVHFIPNARSALRDAGRETEIVEDFYDQIKIDAYRDDALAVLQRDISKYGIDVIDVLIRDVSLPPMIAQAVELKKQREQEVEKERAELQRVRLEAQQQVAKAEADKEAAVLEADARKIRADAEAFAVQRVTKELSAEYVNYVRAQRWNGELPRFTGGGAIPFLNIPMEN